MNQTGCSECSKLGRKCRQCELLDELSAKDAEIQRLRDGEVYYDDVSPKRTNQKRERLYRRVEHLERRIANHEDDGGTAYDRGEASALKWLLNREIELQAKDEEIRRLREDYNQARETRDKFIGATTKMGTKINELQAKIAELEKQLKEFASGEISRESWQYIVNEKTVRLEAKCKDYKETLGEIVAWFDRISRFQHQRLTKGLKEAEQCWAEASEVEPLDFTKAKTLLKKHGVK